MKKRIVALIALYFILVTPVLAAFEVSMVVSSDTSYTMLPVIVNMDNEAIAAAGIITATGLDTRVKNSSVAIPHMLTTDKTLFALSTTATNQYPLSYTTGNAALDNFYIIVGRDGVIRIPYETGASLTNTFIVTIEGYIDTSYDATDRELLYQPNGFKVWVSANEEISASIYHANWTTCKVIASGIATGEHSIVLASDGINFTITIDDNLEDTDGAYEPTGNSYWLLAGENTIPYLECFSVTES